MKRRSKKRREEFDGLTEGHLTQMIRRKCITQVKKSKKDFRRKPKHGKGYSPEY